MLSEPSTKTAPLRPRIEPTAEQLLAAYHRRKRRDWPEGFDAAMADPLRNALVRMEAVRQILADAKAARREALARSGRLAWPAGLRAMKTETITWHELPQDGMPDADITVLAEIAAPAGSDECSEPWPAWWDGAQWRDASGMPIEAGRVLAWAAQPRGTET